MKVKLTVMNSSCRSGLHKAGEEFVVEETCPALCMELWHNAYPYVFALQNGADLDCGEEKAHSFTVRCPDGGRVVLKGEVISE